MSTGTNKERITENNGIISENNADLTALKTRINNLPTSGDTTATANDIALGKTAVSKGVKLTGAVPIGSSSMATTYGANNVSMYQGDVLSSTEQALHNQFFNVGDKISILSPASDVATVAGLTPEILKKDETVLGVTGTYEGSGGTSATPKDVNFYDYDGTITNSYTKSEFLALTEMPSNPTHTGLTAQGWNWDLTDAKSYVTDYGKLNIGQMYATDDGKTRIYIKLEEGRLEPYLGFALNGTATIDWGDNTTDSITGTSTSSYATTLFTKHTYSSAGDYVITIDGANDIYLAGNTTYGSNLLVFEANSANSRVYQNAIQKVELGSNVRTVNLNAFQNCHSLSSITIPSGVTSIGAYVFSNCYSLSSITIPSGVTSIRTYAFQNCSSLSSITIPSGVTSIGTYAFQNCSSLPSITISSGVTSIGNETFGNCYSLSSITIPNAFTSIGAYAFYRCWSLSHITIPSGITSIGNGAFSSCQGIAFYDFTASTSIPTLGSNAFQTIAPDCKIIVPDDLYEDWIVATNWSTYASYIIKESDWV